MLLRQEAVELTPHSQDVWARSLTPLLEVCFYCFRARPSTYGSSQARGQIGATAASLHHGHSNSGSELHLQPHHSSWQSQILNPLSKARDQTCNNLRVPSWIVFHCATTGTPTLFFFFFFLGPHPWHMEVPKLGVESELQLPACGIATAMPDLSFVCDLYHS